MHDQRKVKFGCSSLEGGLLEPDTLNFQIRSWSILKNEHHLEQWCRLPRPAGLQVFNKFFERQLLMVPRRESGFADTRQNLKERRIAIEEAAEHQGIYETTEQRFESCVDAS